MAEFDTIAKHLIHTYPADFARFALQHDDLEVLDVIDTEQPTVEAHRTDSLIRVQVGGEEYQVIRLRDLDGQRILEEGHLGLLPFAPLMQRPASMAAEAWLRQCVNRAQQMPMDEPLKANYLADLAILSGLMYNLETIMAIIAEETMYESSVVQYFTEKALEQGIEQGIQESIQEVLALRFQPEDMHPLARRIGAIDDVQRLKQLHRVAIQVPNLEAFRRLLDGAA